MDRKTRRPGKCNKIAPIILNSTGLFSDQPVFKRELGEYIGSIEMYRERRRGYDRPPREMHTVTCADCGQEAQVPFKPNGTRPVYCQECYRKRRPPRRF